MIDGLLLSLALADLTPSSPTGLPTTATAKPPPAITHRPNDWLLEFTPIGGAVNPVRGQGGYTTGVAVGRMASRWLWAGAAANFQRIGFAVNESNPPQYFHAWAYALTARVGAGWAWRRAALFGVIGGGVLRHRVDRSSFDIIESTWFGFGPRIEAGFGAHVSVHPVLSIGVQTMLTIDFPIGENAVPGPHLALMAAPVFRVHLR